MAFLLADQCALDPRAASTSMTTLVESDEPRGLFQRLALADYAIGGEAVIGPAHRDCFHDHFAIRNAGVLAHHRALHDALAVDHTAQPARPSGIDQRSGHGPAIEGAVVAVCQFLVVSD